MKNNVLYEETLKNGYKVSLKEEDFEKLLTLLPENMNLYLNLNSGLVDIDIDRGDYTHNIQFYLSDIESIKDFIIRDNNGTYDGLWVITNHIAKECKRNKLEGNIIDELVDFATSLILDT